MSSKLKSERKRESVIPGVILVIILGYAAFLLVTTQVEIAQKRNEYSAIHAQMIDLETENEQLKRYAAEENRAEYMEKIARDRLDYANPQERIYYITPGS